MSDETKVVDPTVTTNEVANAVATHGTSGDAKKTRAGGTSSKSKSGAAPKDNGACVKRIPLDDDLKPFPKHYFKDKSKNEIDRLSDSIEKRGLIQPIIVRPSKSRSSRYEIICGHSRVKAANQAGLKEIDAIIRDMTDDESVIMAIETNIAQRSFKNWLPSEKARNVYQYHEAIKHPGRRSDLERKSTPGQNRQGSDDDYSRRKTANAFGVSESTIKTYLALNKLTDGLMACLDRNKFKANAAYYLSFVTETCQKLLDGVLSEYKLAERKPITGAVANELYKMMSAYPGKDLNDSDKNAIKEKIRKILAGDTLPCHKATTPVILPLIF